MKWGHSWFHLTLCTECLQRCPAVFTRAASLPPLSAGGHRDWPGSMSTNQSVSEKEEERSHFTSCSLPSKPVLGACYAKRTRLYSSIQVPFCNKGSFASLDTSSAVPDFILYEPERAESSGFTKCTRISRQGSNRHQGSIIKIVF